MATFDWQTEYHRYRRYFTDLGRFYQTKKARTYVGIILSILTVTFFVIFAIKPALATIAQLIKQTKDQKLVVGELEKKITSLSQAQNEYLAVESDLYLVDEALPQESQVPLLIKQLETLAYQSGVDIGRLRINEVDLKKTDSPKTEKQPLSFNFTALGSYANLKNFLSSLSTLRRIILVESFSFQKGTDEKSGLSLNLAAKAWFLEK
ncbi:MAG: type 4a pilus biogenesis protein PilO [Candidatus Shapirobacteria bacterium]|nr:type 4a pilus biogenesis protein PilO [Candidatus Shapirobacteria bacterium]